MILDRVNCDFSDFSIPFLNEQIKIIKNYLEQEILLTEINKILKKKTNIIKFFQSKEHLIEFRDFLLNLINLQEDKLVEKDDLGDFQTPLSLTDNICDYLVNNKYEPEILLEPTCGKGNFVLSALMVFPSLKKVICCEIQPKYEWLFKLNILKISTEIKIQPQIKFYRINIFSAEFADIINNLTNDIKLKLLIIGNPPWVTNSELSKLNSFNLPKKSNIKKFKGLDALTGKSNFDIAEYIIMDLIQKSIDAGLNGNIAMLCKNTVIQNIIKENKTLSLKLSNIKALQIDFNKFFKIHASGSLFIANFGRNYADTCIYTHLSKSKEISAPIKFGWVDNKFVSDVSKYGNSKWLEGKSPKIWRQGVKHDLSKIMVLHFNSKNQLINGYNEKLDIEDMYLFPFLKSSDLKNKIMLNHRFTVIITQKKVGQPTESIKINSPKLWKYLNNNLDKFKARKSKIYKKKPPFSIFGIGDYAFKPFKIGVSGFYKKLNFCLIRPQENKPVMLDDTSYYLHFDSLTEAFFTWVFLKFPDVKEFFSSIVFITAKRPYTKEVLMRLNYGNLIKRTNYETFLKFYNENLANDIDISFSESDFINFKEKFEVLKN